MAALELTYFGQGGWDEAIKLQLQLQKTNLEDLWGRGFSHVLLYDTARINIYAAGKAR